MADDEPVRDAEPDQDADEAGEPDFEPEESDEDGDDAESAEAAGPEASRRAGEARDDPLLRDSQRLREVVVVPPEERKTSQYLGDLEAAQVLAKRAEQIASTGSHFVKDAGAMSDPESLAYVELFTRRCPLALERELACTASARTVERWPVRDMALPPLPPPTKDAAAYLSRRQR